VRRTTTIYGLERTLLGEIGRGLAAFGFSRPEGQTAERKTDAGRVAVHLSFIEHETDFDVTTDVAIRFDSVEELVHRSNELLSRREKLQTFTLGAELGTLKTGEPLRWTVTSHADVPAVAAAILAELREVGLPYVDQYSQIENAFDVLSRDDREVWVHSPVHWERAKRACALLIVMGRRAEVRALGERKLAFLRSVNDPGIPLFEKFLSAMIAA
jgi:hypothetical protein